MAREEVTPEQRREEIKTKLQEQKVYHEQGLIAINKAIEFAEKNPQAYEFFDITSGAIY